MVFEGVTAGSFHKRMSQEPAGPLLNIWDENDAALDVYCNGCEIHAFSWYDGAVTYEFHVRVDNVLGASDEQFQQRVLPNPGDEWNLNLDGWWRITGVAQEVLEAEIIPVWPSYGGPQVPDPPYETVLHARERWKPGTTLTVAAQIGGIAATASVAVTEANTLLLDYGSQIRAWCEGMEYAGAMSTTHVFKWTSAFGNGSYDLGSDSYYAADAKHSAAGSSGAAVTAQGPSSRTELTVIQYAPKAYSLDAVVRAMEDPFPGDVPVHVKRRATMLTEVLTAKNGVLADSYTQRRYLASAVFLEFLGGSWVVTGPDPEDISPPDYQNISEWADLYLYLDTAWLIDRRDDRRDWRILLRGRSWPAFTLTQAERFTLDDGASLSPSDGTWTAGANTTLSIAAGAVRAVVSGGTGSLTRTWTPRKAKFQSYRYLRFRMRTTAGANVPVNVQIGAKSWTASTGAANEWVERDIDLCAPQNCAVNADGFDSRWPVPTDDDHVDQDGALWGVSDVQTMVLSGLPDGTELEIDRVELVRLGWSRLTVIPAFEHFAKAVQAEDNDQYNRRLVLCDTDGRQSVEEHDLILFAADGSYAIRSISSIVADINAVSDPADNTIVRYPGWQAAEEASFPDIWHTNARDGVCIMGGGARYVKLPGDAQARWVFAFDEEVK